MTDLHHLSQAANCQNQANHLSAQTEVSLVQTHIRLRESGVRPIDRGKETSVISGEA